MEDINTLNSKLQSISKNLEEIQTKVLLQDEKIRKRNKDRTLMEEESKNVKTRLTGQLKILDTEKEELERIIDVTCTLEIERYSVDYSLGLIPSLTLQMCNDYEKFSARTNARIRGMCQTLKDNNFWIDKQNEATAEQAEFKRTLRETLTNRNAFSSSEEERLRNQLEIEETKLAFLMEQISETEKSNSPALPVIAPVHKVTPFSEVTHKPPLTPTPFRPFHSPVRTASSGDRTSMSGGATTHSRAFSPTVTPSFAAATAVSPALVRNVVCVDNSSSDPFGDWADRSSSPRHSTPVTTQPSGERPDGEARRTLSRQNHHNNTQDSEGEVDIELDCTVAAEQQHQCKRQLEGSAEKKAGSLRKSNSVVELTTVRTTITEVTVQRGPQQQFNQITSDTSYQSYAPPAYAPVSLHDGYSPPPYERHYGDHRSEEVPWFKEHKRRRTVGPPAASAGLYGATALHDGAGASGNSPYTPYSPYNAQQGQRQRGVSQYPSPTASTPYSSYSPTNSTGSAAQQGLWPFHGVSTSPNTSPPTYYSKNNYNNTNVGINSNSYSQSRAVNDASRSSPPLWPATTEPNQSTPKSHSSAGISFNQQRGTGAVREPDPSYTWTDFEGPDNGDRRAGNGNRAENFDHRSPQTQRASPSVIDLYDTSDSENSDADCGSEKLAPNYRHHRRAPEAVAAGTAAAGGRSSSSTGSSDVAARSHMYEAEQPQRGLHTHRVNQQGQGGPTGQSFGQNLKDRFHTGLALLQQTQASALGDID